MTAPSPQNPGLLNWLLILLLGVIWGAAFLSVRVSLDGFGPWTVAAYRVAIGGALLAVVGLTVGQGPEKIRGKEAWRSVVFIGLCTLAVPIAALSWGQQFAPSAFAGVAMGLVPLLVLPLVMLFSPDEGIGPRRIIGALMGFAGLMLLIAPGAFDTTGNPNDLAGRLAIMIAPFGYVLGSVATRRAPKMPPLAFASGTLLVAACALMPIALLVEGWPKNWPLRPSAALAYAALLPTALAAVIRIRVITTAGSIFMSLTSYMVPVWSVIFGIVLLGEDLPASLFYALALILAGIAIAQSRALLAHFRP